MFDGTEDLRRTDLFFQKWHEELVNLIMLK